MLNVWRPTSAVNRQQAWAPAKLAVLCELTANTEWECSVKTQQGSWSQNQLRRSERLGEVTHTQQILLQMPKTGKDAQLVTQTLMERQQRTEEAY